MVTMMDDGIANITAALDVKGIRDNTIIIFSTGEFNYFNCMHTDISTV